MNSWEPLDVSIFSVAYLKMCGSDFDLRNLSDTLRHLSNYSLQKKGEVENPNSLVMSTTKFEEFAQQDLNMKDFTWAKDMLPKISDVVWRSLKSMQET